MEAMTTPQMPQHMEALRIANETRRRVIEARRDLMAGRRTFSETLDDPRVESVEVLRLLMTLRAVGRARGLKFLRRAGDVFPIPEKKRVGDLTSAQRRRLREVLAEAGY